MAVLFLGTSAALGVLLVRTRGDLSDAKATVKEFEQREADRAAAEEEVPDLMAVARKHFDGTLAVVSGDTEAVRVVIRESAVVDGGPALASMLEELGFGAGVLDRMSQTRALDGTLSADGKNCNVTWTYHPDDGLQMVFEADQP